MNYRNGSKNITHNKTMAKPKTLFDMVADVHPVFNGAKVGLASIDTKFDREKHGGAAVEIQRFSAEETGFDWTEDQTREFLQTATKEDVKRHLDAGFAIYGRRLDDVMENKFDELWTATPKDARGDLYNLITLFAPKKDITGLSTDFEKALKEHKFLAKIGDKLSQYQSRNITPSKREELDKEFFKMYTDEIDKAYCDTPEKAKEYKELVDAMKKWAKKSHQMLVRRLITKQDKSQEKFNELVRLEDDGDKKANFHEYMSTVLDTEGRRSLYGTAGLYYAHNKREKKEREASDYRMAG